MYIYSLWVCLVSQTATKMHLAHSNSHAVVSLSICALYYLTANVLVSPFPCKYIHIYMSQIVFLHITEAKRIHSQSWLCIYAADLYPSGSGSAVLDKYIQSQETKTIPTLFSLLALDQ